MSPKKVDLPKRPKRIATVAIIVYFLTLFLWAWALWWVFALTMLGGDYFFIRYPALGPLFSGILLYPIFLLVAGVCSFIFYYKNNFILFKIFLLVPCMEISYFLILALLKT